MHTRSGLTVGFLIALTWFAVPVPAYATWPHLPYYEVVLTSTPATSPVAAPDGAGGMIVAWVDTRSDAGDIYVQRVDVGGNVRWGANGLAAGVATGQQTRVVIVPDGAGGAFLAWEDYRGVTNGDVYAQHVTSDGAVAAGWPTDGLAVAAETGNQILPAIVSDGGTGAYVVWEDHHFATADIFAKHLLSGGIDGSWPSIGATVCFNASSQQQAPRVASDGTGGAYVIWQDTRSGTIDLYMNRLLANGTVAWASTGVGVTTSSGDQINPVLGVIPGSGVRVVFQEDELGASWDVASTFVSISGGVSVVTPVSATTDDEVAPVITNVGNGNMVVAWQRKSADYDVYAAFLGGSAVPLSTAFLGQISPLVVPDGTNGAIVVWTDQGFGGEIFAQRLDANGQTSWPGTNGVDVGNAGSGQSSPTAVADGKGGALIAFVQSGVGLAAQRVEHFGYLCNPEPQISRIFDIPSDQGGLVHVVWNASYLDTDPSYTVGSYNVWRQIDAAAATRAIANGARPLKAGETADGKPAIRTTATGSTTLTWEFLGSVPARANATYSFPAATLADSMPDGPHDTVFMVDVQARTGAAFWSSSPDSGHSVDNLAPAAPAALTGDYADGATHLHWSRNSESDLAGYRIYRGSDVSFVPSPDNLIASVADTGYADLGSAGGYYKLSAVDVHGNESSYALLQPGTTTAVPPGSPLAFELGDVHPNPARGPAQIAFSLPAAAHVRLGVYDVAGRLRRTLLDGDAAAGQRSLSWDLRDDAGRPLGAALYFVRIDSPFGASARRVMVLE